MRQIGPGFTSYDRTLKKKEITTSYIKNLLPGKVEDNCQKYEEKWNPLVVGVVHYCVQICILNKYQNLLGCKFVTQNTQFEFKLVFKF